MTDGDFRTLAYTKSPKVSSRRRTTFQDELEAAVSARASRTKTDDQYSYLDDFDEDGDDFQELFKSRKKRVNAFKSGRSKATINNFDLSDDEGENDRPKRVSFMKTQRSASPLQSTAATDSHEGERPDPSPGSSDWRRDSLTPQRHDPSLGSSNRRRDSLTPQHSLGRSEERMESTVSEKSGADSHPPCSSRRPPTGSLSLQTSEASWLDTPLPLPSSDGGNLETPVPLFAENSEQSKDSVRGEGVKAPSPQPAETGSMRSGVSSTDGVGEREPPRPKPRQRTFGLSSRAVEEPADDPGSPVSRAATSSVSIALSTDKASSTTTADTSSGQITASSLSPHGPEGDQTDSSSFRRSSSPRRSQQSHSLSRSTGDSETRDKRISEDSKDHEEQYSTSFEEFHDAVTIREGVKQRVQKRHMSMSLMEAYRCTSNQRGQVLDYNMNPFQTGLTLKMVHRSQTHEDSEDHPDHSVSRLSDIHEKSSETRPSSSSAKSSQRSRSACSSKVESKYMGMLTVLDRKVALEESKPEAADSLRAAVYQEWLKKKKESSRLKKQEDNLKEEKRKQGEWNKTEDAKASYEAWKQNKAGSLRARAKEKHDTTTKEQRVVEEQAEKRESSRKVFEKWKQEHDQLLKEKYRSQRRAENKLKEKKQETEEERQRNSKSAFSNWDGKRKNVLSEKVMKERKEIENKAEEERYMREERDKMSLDMYETWLTKKDREERRRQEERLIQAILQDEPPPPWSPASKTVPFRK